MPQEDSHRTHTGQSRITQALRRTFTRHTPQTDNAAPSPASPAVAGKVADMFEDLRDSDWRNTVDCNPLMGEEAQVLQCILDTGRTHNVTVKAQVRHGWIKFHAEPNHESVRCTATPHPR